MPEELYVLALWKRIADRQLNWMARRFCPHWYNPEWMVLGSLSRAIKRFQKHVCGFTAKLETPSFGAYKALLLKSAVIDEYRFVKGQGRGIFLQFRVYDVIDDAGALIRGRRPDASAGYMSPAALCACLGFWRNRYRVPMRL